MGFNYENNLTHQTNAIQSALAVFIGAEARKDENINLNALANPHIILSKSEFSRNIKQIQYRNNIINGACNENSNMIDISMETGTGKTYTYTKLMFALNKALGLCKFIIIVPTLSIKAGTISFLDSKATKEHFNNEFERKMNLYVVQSQKKNKSNKKDMPHAVSEFVGQPIENTHGIEILVINQGMLNSLALDTSYDKTLLDRFDKPFDALAALKPVLIIDEPHKFKQANKTFENIRKMGAQFIFRFGATFENEEQNLVYKLTSVQAFNENLVKGVKVFVSEFEGAAQEKAVLKLLNFNQNEARFELLEDGKGKNFTIGKKEKMSKIHADLESLWIENIGKNVMLSNGLELKKGSVIAPYSYNETLQEKMIKMAVEAHFECEREFFAREDKIKPLTLFFIDDIEGYRSENGNLRIYFERLIETKMQNLLKDEENKHDRNEIYIEYLKKSLQNIALTHGGYFSQDNSESDEKIEKEINEILHDKERLLSFENPRRFIFSKWTLREGWDNPNVFGICKLRSSGSVTSKLQEVGRGLRLPVNEYGARIKSGEFFLNYFVDFTEKDFAQTLIGEINAKSTDIKFSENDKELNKELAREICKIYGIDMNKFYIDLMNNGVITPSHEFEENGFAKLKALYSLAFENVRGGKILNANEQKPTAHIRVGKFNELKELWEKINQKAILQYNIKSEADFLALFVGFLKENRENFKRSALISKKYTMRISESVAYFDEIENTEFEFLPNSYMNYGEFLLKLSGELKAKISTLHQAFCKIHDFNINDFLSEATIRFIKHGFAKYILDNSITKFSIEYKKIKNSLNLHASAFTDKTGKPLTQINAAILGTQKDDGIVAIDSYMFDEIYYDSELERENILSNIDTISVFTKIPKNSIKIPVSGGGSYSPDFAYIVQDKQSNQTLHLIVEVKNKESRDLLGDEKQKIAHAQEFFKAIDKSVKITFKTQLQGQKIKELIYVALNKDFIV